MIFGLVTPTLDPVWPWSLPGVGIWLILGVAATLVALTFWTYHGVEAAGRRRVLILTGLRLAALLMACLAVLRPSLAFQEEARAPSLLLVAADASESMTIRDQFNSQSRWEDLCRLLRDQEPLFRRLRDEHQVTVLRYRFAEDIGEFDPNGSATGKRTDFGTMLTSLLERHASDRNLRGLLILSDGADNGSRYPVLPLAARWRSLPCPIQTFVFGKTTTTAQQRDIAFTAINPEPSPVAIKGKLTVKGIVDASSFAGVKIRAHLLINDQEVMAQNETLEKDVGNEIRLVCDAPAEPGEVKVTLKIDPVEGEMSVANNEISTYVTVTKEGISVLYVEGKYRAWEPKFIRYALAQDPNIRLFESVRVTDDAPGATEASLYDLDKQHYDVIILGDISARRLSAGNPSVLAKIEKLVAERGTGLLMIGGYESFGNSDWDRTELAKVLPVQLDVTGQIDGLVQMVPTADGLRHYVLRLAEQPSENAAAWKALPKLNGMTRLGRPKANAVVLARSDRDEPILVGLPSYGQGRTLAFAGDTTWRWRSSPKTVQAHSRFWRQMILWLAKRDEADGNVVILPDTRRLPAGGKLGFTVKVRGKGGVELPADKARFEVNAVGPGNASTVVPTARERGEERGTFWKTDEPGEYQLIARATGTDVDGKPLPELPPAKVRFLVYRDEAEMVRQGADPDFLEKLAASGGGKLHQPEELKTFLQELTAQVVPKNQAHAKLWPDWRRLPSSRGARDQVQTLIGSGILACFVLFVLLLSLEWLLRRIWGLV